MYFGTPVVLISTLNEDNTPNLAPMSSAWWLGKSCMLGMSTRSKTVENMKRHPECVLNLPSPDLVENVNRLAMLTGKNPVPDYKMEMGYSYEPKKFEISGLNYTSSHLIKPPRVVECPVQLEAVVKKIHNIDSPEAHLSSIEVKIIRVHIEEDLLESGTKNYIDPLKWSPLIMNFCEFFGLSKKLHPSRLATAFAPNLSSNISQNSVAMAK
ncbi:MAG: hypothetical protein HeimC3_21300 [Candidatus Heimdallarchaeota archaeon LC_3]|nr:MAG: hypothetical protein HeimC3_21300 [Candidatus Heimdallarchaeota archaeon LC_3]